MSAVKVPSGEAALVALFKIDMLSSNTVHEDRIPFDPVHDTVVFEMQLRVGRADIVVFHAMGSVSVIEVKDGGCGLVDVCKGIGQVGLYATQIGMAKTGLKVVRRCLMWSSVGDEIEDALIEQACEAAGVIALPYPHSRVFESIVSAFYAAAHE